MSRTRTMEARAEVETLDGPMEVVYRWTDREEHEYLPFGSTSARREWWELIDDSETYTVDDVPFDKEDLEYTLSGVDVEALLEEMANKAHEV